jgi:hypothetical protein
VESESKGSFPRTSCLFGRGCGCDKESEKCLDSWTCSDFRKSSLLLFS